MRYEERSSRYGDMPEYSLPFDIPGRSGTASLTDLVSQYARFNTMLMDRLGQTLADVMDPPRTRERNPKHRHFKDECKDPCYHDPCHCRCCIYDADLVVYARLGEVRVVPIRIENHRRRERDITLVLSDWTTHSGKKTGIHADILPDLHFKLAPCSEKEVILVINARQLDPEQDKKEHRERELPDVDDCLVLYADLRVEGCSVRPVRIALALLPRDCYPYVIECRSSCC
jgi:hypothetical protein